ncbi:hypothetical protein [Halomonas halodenitrificans]|uniref:hypothetical protein n=1 Tax=Halomonas halodenitrificans TaxID=28252 RepID=UPI0012EBE201|nr:hypothetical protein [Halomonas halodenitrificans]
MTEQSRPPALEARISEVKQSLEQQEEKLSRCFDEVARATRTLEEEQAKQAAWEQELGELRRQLAEAAEQSRQAAELAPQAGGGKETDAEKLQRHAKLVQESDLFDAEWYLAAYPDVRQAEQYSKAPHEHYLRHGGFEGRNPCPEFDSAYYLKTYPDVAEAGTNPLVHYLLHGRNEGRRIFPPFEDDE